MNLLDAARLALAEAKVPEFRATAEQAVELRELVWLVAADWPEDQRAEALAAALADPVDALTCYRALAANKRPAATTEANDDRRTCAECANLSPNGRCFAAWRSESIGLGIATGHTYLPDVARPLRCAAYEPGPHDPDRRGGTERWPWLIETRAD